MHGPIYIKNIFMVVVVIVEVSRSHSDRPHSIGPLSTRDTPVAKTTT